MWIGIVCGGGGEVNANGGEGMNFKLFSLYDHIHVLSYIL